MVSLPQAPQGDRDEGGACGSSCGAGLEKVYPSTAVRYGAMNWIGEFRLKPGAVFSCGARVVIQSDRGIELGRQVSLTCHGCDKSVTREQIKRYIDNSGAEYFRLGAGRVLREATPEDISEQEHLNAHARDEADHAALLAAQLSLDMKIVTVEHLLGGERVVYYFMADGRVDFRGLVRALAERHQTRIEMRQVGARDEARLVADYEICGRECCCKNFLKTLRPVTMKMAKLQKATLDLSKVSGRCGRLRCCLRYEHEGYEVLAARLPRRGARVRTDHGVGTVVDTQILTQLVMLRTDDEKVVTVPLEEIRETGLPERPLPSPAPAETASIREPRRPLRGRGPVVPPSRPAPPIPQDVPDAAHFVADEAPEDPPPDEPRDFPLQETGTESPPGSPVNPPSADGDRRRPRRRRRRGPPPGGQTPPENA